MRIGIDLQPLQTASKSRGIGRYSLSLAKAMIAQGRGHDFYLILNASLPDTFDQIEASFADQIPKSRIRAFSVPLFADSSEGEVMRGHAEIIREFSIEVLDLDWFHISSPFEPGLGTAAVSSIGRFASVPSSATVYDFIPHRHRDLYSPGPLYDRQMQYLRNARVLMAISEHTRNEAIELLNFPPDRVVNISADADPQFRRVSDPRPIEGTKYRYGISRPFVMYTGGADPRKNTEKLIEAYASLPSSIREGHQLVLCYDLHGEGPRLTELLGQFGLSPGEVVFTGFVSDEELRCLYSACKLFVFPSLSEGFGLPILEAMRCGAPVLGSNATSIPEVIGNREALFDPTSSVSLKNKIQQALTDEDFRQDLIRKGTEQSRKFSWKTSAQRALEAIEAAARNDKRTLHHIDVPRYQKPTLAYLSPLPPERSGIADYSAELLPELARHYDITLVTDVNKLTNESLERSFKKASVAEFSSRGGRFDRVLYHFGNSEFHNHMFGLLRTYPGTVVLHDFFLGDLLQFTEDTTPKSTIFRQAVYESHGYSGLMKWKAHGSAETAMQYPCSLPIFRQAHGVIVHSEYSMRLAQEYYGIRGLPYIIRIPHLRRLPAKTDRAAARRKLSMADDVFLVCCFGFLGPIKLNDRLLESWKSSGLAHRPQCRLVFVGGDTGGDYERKLRGMIRSARLDDQVEITGYADPTTYRCYLDAADAAVQLRGMTRGETSGTVLDCMSRGIPVIVNGQGSLAELPEDAVLTLPAEPKVEELAAALERVLTDPSLRAAIGEAAIRYVKSNLDPAIIAMQYTEAIELFAATHPLSVQKRVISVIASSFGPRPPSQAVLASIAQSIAEDTPTPGPRRLLVDVSTLATIDARTGIQRVTRNILRKLCDALPQGYRLEPVRRSQGIYRYARSFAAAFFGTGGFGLKDDPVDVQAGDIFLGLDLDASADDRSRAWLRHHRQRGMNVSFVVYDILPVARPEFFDSHLANPFRVWLQSIACLADNVVCISQSTAQALLQWLQKTQPPRQTDLPIGYFHLGSDLESDATSAELTPQDDRFLKAFQRDNLLLAVGTVEPRKGYKDVLKAFDTLLQQGFDLSLLIIGKEGWDSETASRLKCHPELNKRLFWRRDASDEMLSAAYQRATALIAASEDEGFGLPIIEAAQHGLPIIARDIPVFREVAGDNAFYFSGLDGDSLANAIKDWLQLYRRGQHPRSELINRLTWKQSAEQLKKVIFEGNWLTTWKPPRAGSTS